MLDIAVGVGDVIPKGKELLRLAPTGDDQQPTVLASPYPARVLDISVQKHATVEKDAVLVTLEPRDKPLRAILYVPVADGYQVAQAWDTAKEKGGTVPVHVWPASVGKESGPLLGHVWSAAHFPASKSEMERTLGSPGAGQQPGPVRGIARSRRGAGHGAGQARHLPLGVAARGAPAAVQRHPLSRLDHHPHPAPHRPRLPDLRLPAHPLTILE